MADDNIDLQLNLDSSGFVQGANQAAAAAAQMGTAVGGAERSSSMLGKALSLVTPGRVMTGSFGAAAIAAGHFQSEMQGISATAAASGANARKLAQGVNELARAFPVGQRGAIQVVSTLQSMGVTGVKNIKTVEDLSKSYIRLGAATGTNAALIGRQMTTLNRAFGAADGNISRFNKMSDALVGVTAKIGGSAPDILAFSKNIAPMARQAGIGQTAVMGISAAFSKMGEDGYVASNTMSKVLSDLNRSVRDGSGEMNTYANIVGKTRTEFEAMFKLNPTQALQEVLQSLAEPGSAGQRNAERIGLDGVRAQRSMQAIAQQGGIASAAATATAEYGGGSTQRAAQVAMGGLNDSLTKLRDSALQVTEALGTPFLGALTKVVNVTAAPIKGAAAALDSGLIQRVIQIAAPAALLYLGARGLGAIGLGAATGRQIVNNGLFRGFTEGNRMAYANSGPVGPMTQAQADKRLENMGNYGKATGFAIRMGQGFGEARSSFASARMTSRYDQYVARGMDPNAAYARASEPTPSLRSQLRNAPRAIANTVWGAQRTYNQAMQESARMLREDDPTLRRTRSPFRFQRQNALPPGVLGPQGPATGPLGKLNENLKSAYNSAGTFSERMTRVSATLTQAGSAQLAAGGSIRTAGRIVVTSLENTAVGLRAFAGAVKASGIGGAAMGGLKGAAGMFLNPMMIGMIAGGGILSNISGNKSQDKSEAEAFKDRSITAGIDAYRDSMGLATDATQSFAEQMTSATAAVMRTVSNVQDAAKVSDTDRAYADQTKDKVTHKYAGSNTAVAEQIRALSPSGIGARELEGIKVDLLRQRPDEDVRQIMAAITAGSSGDSTKAQGPDFGKMFAGSVGKGNALTGWDKFRRGLLGQQGNADEMSVQSVAGQGLGMGIAQTTTNVLDWMGFGGKGSAQAVGRNLNKEKVRDDQKAGIESMTGAVAQQYGTNEESYGVDYARQERLRTANQAYAGVAKTGNKDLIAAASKELTALVGGSDNRMAISEDDAKKYGGFVQAFQHRSKAFGQASAGIDLDPTNGTTGLTPKLTDSHITTLTDGIDIFGRALSNRTADVNSALNKTVAAFLKTPGDMDKFRASLAGLSAAGGSGSDSLTRVGDAALQTVKALGDATSDASKLATASFEESYGQNERNAGFQGSRQTNQNRLGFAKSLMQSADATPEGQERFTRGRDMAAQVRESQRQQMVGMLQAQMQFQKQSGRAEEDWLLQRGYAWTDYNKNVGRAEEDFHISRVRAERDFHIQMAQGQEDFNISRARANRDYNKSIKRMNEDAAKSMYDPFKRMQVEAVSDMGTLMVNLAEQNEAMERQAKNLDRLRKAGVNNHVIDQLGLGKSENAQQAQRALDDVTSGAVSASDLNKMVGTRMKDAATLAGDSSNTDLARQAEDFKQSLTDQNNDYAKQVKRANQAFGRSLADQNADFEKNLGRQHKDFVEQLARQRKAMDTELARQHKDIVDSQKEILGDFDTLATAVQDAMSGKAVDFRKLMKNTLTGTLQDTKDMVAKFPQFFQGVIAAAVNSAPQPGSGVANTTSGSGHAMDPTAGGDGTGMGYQAQAAIITQQFPGERANGDPGRTGKTVSGNESYHTMGRAVDISPPKMSVFDWIASRYPNSAELIYTPAGNRQLKNGKSHVYGPDVAKGHYNHIHWAMAKGGIAKGGLGGLQATVAEAGSNEAVIPLDSRGVAVLAQAMTQYMTGPDAQRLLTGGHGDRITYTGNTFTYDHSTQINGEITVQAQDPNQMARELQAKARRGNLTSTSTRKR